MRKFERCGTLVTGVIMGVVLSVTVTAFAAGVITKAEYNSNKVSFNGQELTLSAPLITIVDEDAPQNAVNYMPVRAVLEAMGNEVAWDAASSSINITSSVAEQSASAPLAKVTMNGKEVTVSGSSSGESEYVVDYKVVMESLALMGVDVDWDKDNAAIVAATHVDEIEEPLAIRELLTKLEEQGVKNEIVFDDDKREVYLTKGALKATVILPLGTPESPATAKVVCGKNETEITIVIKGGTTFINEKEMTDALIKVNFLK